MSENFDDHYEVVREWEAVNGVLWQEVIISSFGVKGRMVRAVCRPESCLDRHRCGKLDIGIVGEDS